MKLKYWLALSVTFGIIVVIFAFYKITFLALDKYNDTRLDPIEITKTSSDFSKTYDYVFLGDSHCYFWKLDNKNELNLGVSGQTSSQIFLRSELMKGKLVGRNLILSVGANDVKCIATNPDNANKIIDDCITNIQKIINNHKKSFVKIYIITIPPDFSPSLQAKVFNYEKTVAAKNILNKKIIDVSNKNSVVLIDAFNILSKKMNNESLSSDGIHLNAKAYYYYLNKEILE